MEIAGQGDGGASVKDLSVYNLQTNFRCETEVSRFSCMKFLGVSEVSD
jgi:hypothetical protein